MQSKSVRVYDDVGVIFTWAHLCVYNALELVQTRLYFISAFGNENFMAHFSTTIAPFVNHISHGLSASKILRGTDRWRHFTQLYW